MSIMGGQEWDEKIFQEGQKGLAANKKKPDISAWLVVAGTGLTNIADHQYVACLWGQIRGQKYRDYWILNGFESIKL